MRFSDPVAAFDAAVEALHAGEVERFGECFDPVSIEQLRRQILEGLRREPSRMTVEDFMRHQPKMPQAVAEYQVAEANRYSDPLTRLKTDFPDANSIDDVETMTPAAFYFSYVDAHSMRRQIKRLVDDGRAPASMLESFREPTLRALGSISGNERVAWVVFQEEHSEFRPTSEWLQWYPEREQPMAIDLARAGHPHFQACYRQDDGGWKLLADFMGFGRGNTQVVAISESEKDDAE